MRTVACLLWMGICGPVLAAERAVPDLVLTNAVVHTVDPSKPSAEAVAITGNRISAVGSQREVLALLGPTTRVIDLAGATVVPGFKESHAHLLSLGRAKMNLDLTDARSYGEVVAKVAAVAKTQQAGEWILGRGWHEGKWVAPPQPAVRGFPTHDALSAVSPDHPVALTRADGHALLVNARAMSLMGIGSGTDSPAGGDIVRDSQGQPIGVFVDRAEGLIRTPEPSRDQKRKALQLAFGECLADGITAFEDAGVDSSLLDLYRELARDGRLPIRLHVMLAGYSTLQRFERPEVGLGDGFLDIRSVKLYADGALGSRGAALLEPYSDDPGHSGFLVETPEALLEATRYALDHGFQVKTHAIGDRGNRVTLDVYQQALRERPNIKDARLRIEHAQVLDHADIPRFAQLGIVAAMQGIHVPSDRPWAPDRLGMDRVKEGAYAWRKLLDSGARIVNGTDAPVESVSPLKCIYASVTRASESGVPPEGFDPEERVTREEALRSYTLDGAYAVFHEDVLGSITVGKLADLTVLSSDILKIPAPDILKTRVLFTIVDGQVRYRADQVSNREASR